MDARTCAELRYSGTVGKIRLKKAGPFDVNLGFLPQRWKKWGKNGLNQDTFQDKFIDFHGA